MTIEADSFQEDPPRRPVGQLVLDLDGFEGPIDVLLVLAREQKVDLARISILQLADQYLDFIRQARGLRLELAADYLVMAAWLAYLKSRLLLPEPQGPDEPSGEEMAAMLAFQLRRLEAMRDLAARLMARPRLGRDVFARGAPEGLATVDRSVYQASLFELLAAYADQRRRTESARLEVEPSPLYSVDDALHWLTDLIGRMPDWEAMTTFLPPDLQDGLIWRSAVASTFAASLELAKQGRLQLRQAAPFGPLYLRTRARLRAADPEHGDP
ncbi:MAG: segregation and condensation protein A [Kiloniellales bacterium]